MPIADAEAAFPAFAVVAAVLMIDVGLGHFGNRRSGRGDFLRTVGGFGLAVVAAVLAIVSVFQPAFESSLLDQVEKNTLIQKETGWLILACAVGIIAAVCLAYFRRTTTWAVFSLGLVIYGAAIYQTSGNRDALEGGRGGLLVLIHEFHGTPAVAVYAAGAAGLLAIYAGLVLASPHLLVARRPK